MDYMTTDIEALREWERAFLTETGWEWAAVIIVLAAGTTPPSLAEHVPLWPIGAMAGIGLSRIMVDTALAKMVRLGLLIGVLGAVGMGRIL